jgi:hypothetical protein
MTKAFIFSLHMLALLVWNAASAFQASKKCSTHLSSITSTTTQLEMAAIGRRETFISFIWTAGFLTQTLPSKAAADSTAASAKNPFDLIRFELYDPSGGVARMQQRVDDRDFEGLLEFTKGYDQVLRKQYMGKAKKTLPKELQEKATIACNSVTFDLIGINRCSRKGQESYDGALKYLNELKVDAEKFLVLEGITDEK